jgi:hypothetical protein
LEITVAPRDLRHLEHILPHQLRQWADQVQEIVCTADLRPSAGEIEQHDAEALVRFVESCSSDYPHARLAVADYSPATSKAVSAMFFGGHRVPAKTFRAGPFYAYFYGLYAAGNDFVLHLDSDMLFGGGSKTWVTEAVELLREDEDVLLCEPLPGPPRADGAIMQPAEPYMRRASAFRFATVTTRLFLLHRQRLLHRVGVLEVRRHPPVRRRVPLATWLRGLRMMPLGDRLRPLVLSTPPYELPERLLGDAMVKAALQRVAFLGEPPGMWSLHPADRTDRFYASLPTLIERIEHRDVTDDQRGHYDLRESMLA